jgi:hypothetical protein
VRSEELDRIPVVFARLLRDAGIDVPAGATAQFARALAATGAETRDAVYWAGRATLIRRHEDMGDFDRCFDALFLGTAVAGAADPSLRAVTVGLDVPAGDSDDAATSDAGDDPVIQVRYSRAEILRERDFASYTPEEHAEARRLMADLRVHSAMRRSRRTKPTTRRRGRPDLRSTVRRSLASGGEPIVRAFREPAERSRRLVLLCDVSGSMEPYARALARFLHSAVVAGSRVEAFALGTRLTRITRELSSRDPDVALAAAARRVTDWSGGTRLGDGLKTFNDVWGLRGMARGAVVEILSDGWDRGDAALLAEQMARLSRVAYRIVWVNPLKASEGYEPLAAGMAAALPYIDEFVEGHSLAALEQLNTVLAR